MILQIFDYLQELSDEQINQLYGSYGNSYSQSQWVCRAVFQSISELGKYITMRLLFLTQPISSNDLILWYNGDNMQYFNTILQELLKSRILQQTESNEYVLNHGFRESMKFNLSGIHEPWTEIKDELMLIVGKNAPTEQQLNEECIKKWNCILQFMITPDDPSLQISQTVRNYLLGAGLMHYVSSDGSYGNSHSGGNGNADSELHIRIVAGGIVQSQAERKLCITSNGYEYLLLDIQTQVWNFAYECLKKSGSLQIEVLSFLFMLSFCHVGHSYPVSLLTQVQAQLMVEFSHLGIIYLSSLHSSRFYPTQIAVNMINNSKIESKEPSNSQTTTSLSTSTSSSLTTSSSTTTSTTSSSSSNISGLELIIETNFQVVAYCTSDLHIAMLSLFVDKNGRIRFPNMILGQITRESIKNALRMGIKSQQIINFMLIHTHPRMKNRNPIIPENVTDQIKLWESEQYRLKTQPSFFINLPEIASGKHLESLYAQLKNYSKEINVLLWFDDQKKFLVVTIEGYHQLEAFSKTID